MRLHHESRRPRGVTDMDPDTIHARRYLILAVLCVSLVLVGMSMTILNVAIPDILHQLHADADDLQWIFSAYGIIFAGLVITMGAISDRYGRKRLLNVGLTVFGVASALGAFAGFPGQLIAARAFMGVGAAMVMPGTLSIIESVFPIEERQQAIGIWAGVGGLGFILGPPIGGLLLTSFWWGSVLLANVPVVVIALLVGARIVPEFRDPARLRLDLVGAALSILSIGAIVYAFISAPDGGWGSPPVVGALIVALAAGASFVRWELSRAHPMLDVRLFRRATFAIPALLITFGSFAVWGLEFLLPQYLQFVRGDTVLAVGLILATISLTWSGGSPIVPRAVTRYGSRNVMLVGLIVGMVGALFLVGVGTGDSLVLVLLSLAALGLGMAIASIPATGLLVSSLPVEKAGVGSSMNDVTREFGTAFGVAVLGTVVSVRYAQRLGHLGLSGKTLASAREGISQALTTAQHSSAPRGQALRSGARTAFVSGFRLAALVAALIFVALAVATWAKLPKDAAIESQPIDEPTPAPDPAR